MKRGVGWGPTPFHPHEPASPGPFLKVREEPKCELLFSHNLAFASVALPVIGVAAPASLSACPAGCRDRALPTAALLLLE
jgi:hypothetical protein